MKDNITIDETQMALIGTAILNKDRFIDLLEYPEDIFTYPMSNIYKAMKQLHDSDMELDIYSITNYLKHNDDTFNTDFLLSIYQMPTVTNYKYLLETALHVRNKKLVSDYAKDLFSRCQSRDLEYKDFLDQVINIKDIISEQFNKKYVPLKDEMYSLHTENGLKYYKTGIDPLDNKIVGLFQGRFIIIAASPGAGKSTLARQISYKKRFLFFTLEMTKQEILANILMQYSGIESWRILADKLTDTEKDTIVKVKKNLETTMHFTIIDDVYDINQIINITKSKHKRGEIDGMVLDYMQLCSGAKGENQNIKIGYISRQLKMLSGQLKIPVIGLSQFSRGSDKEDRQPELTDLRDSGSLEQDANCVIFLHTKKEERLKDICPVNIIVAKNRGGRVGIIKDLVFKKSLSQITDLEQETNFEKMNYIHN